MSAAIKLCQLAVGALHKHEDHPQYIKITMPGIQVGTSCIVDKL
jgi:hypothetical protein